VVMLESSSLRQFTPQALNCRSNLEIPFRQRVSHSFLLLKIWLSSLLSHVYENLNKLQSTYLP